MDGMRESLEVGVGAAVQRKFDDLLRIDELSAGAGVGFDQGDSAGDLDNFFGTTNFESEIDTLAGVDDEIERIGLGGFKAGGFGAKAIVAEVHADKFEIAVGISEAVKNDAGPYVGESDGDSGDDGAAGIVNGAEDRARFELREGWRRAKKQEEEKSE